MDERKFEKELNKEIFCCKGKYGFKTAGGYHWMYYDEYLKLINEGVAI